MKFGSVAGYNIFIISVNSSFFSPRPIKFLIVFFPFHFCLICFVVPVKRPVIHKVRRWPVDLAVPDSSPA